MKKKNIYVSIVALIDWQGKVLISLRPKNKKLSNFWEFPGGKVKNAETPDNAIIREVKEELLIDINQKSLKPLSFLTHEYDDTVVTLFFYICRSWKGTPKSNEKQKIMWVEIEKLKQYKFIPGSNNFVIELCNLKKS
ncbi:MAG: 8-oxo-dGTP diphosphatase [Alphaproteobacteria bacterium MarineAlpha6_Bin3]|nr:MAG: 8-oxo-dGTP diphosphatase [Alphaproteobacteria bacterium MarineAlpha6_Bin3]